MSDNFPNLAADLYVAADMIGHEVVGAITSVQINSDSSERVALNGVVRSHFTRQPSASVSVSPSMTIPQGTQQTVDNKTLTISKAKAIEIPAVGEDVKHLDNGSGFQSVYGDKFVQAMRTLTNEIEVDLCTAIYQGGSRAIGTPGTNAFATNFNLVAQSRQILVDNGQVPSRDTSMVIDTLSGTNLRNMATLQKANEAGSDQMLRQGELLDLQGIFLKESAGVQAHTKGTGSSLQSSAAKVVGDTIIALDTGSGTVLVGDHVTFAGDTNKYVVTTALASGTLTIASPGLRQTLADNVAMTVGNTTVASSFVIKQGAAELVIRPPAMPEGGDAATKSMMVTDPYSGLIFELREYKGYHKAMYSIAMAWGFKVWKEDGVAIILG